MAKGRELATSRSERYLGRFGFNQDHGTVNSGPSDLVEADVWSAVDDVVNGGERSGNVEWSSRSFPKGEGSFGGYGRGNRLDGRHPRGGLSLAFFDSGNTSPRRIVHQYRPQESSCGQRMGTSAPVNVPDWSMIYRVGSIESLHDSDDGLDCSDVVPPHEYLARSRNAAANSVFEGVGRTLKGRDLSRVRDAVWSQTGFDG